MRKSFDWKLSTDAEIAEHILKNPHNSVCKQLHYYKRTGNDRMYERLARICTSIGRIAGTWKWEDLNDEQIVERVAVTTRRVVLSKIRELRIEGKTELAGKIEKALIAYCK